MVIMRLRGGRNMLDVRGSLNGDRLVGMHFQKRSRQCFVMSPLMNIAMNMNDFMSIGITCCLYK